jgi:transposase-like protein
LVVQSAQDGNCHHATNSLNGTRKRRVLDSSAILPPYARRSKSLEVLIPMLYLKGISTGDFEEALLALLGHDAGGLSASTIGRLKEVLVGGAHAVEQARSLGQATPRISF